jgi:DNA polymerase III epsilon subunit-like protein
MPAPSETFLSVDIETSGPHPERYSLLSIGACLVDDPAEGFYIELKPAKSQVMDSVLHTSQLSVEKLARDGVAAPLAMQQFTEWIRRVCPPGQRPVMVAFNAPYDWAFINSYFYEYLGENPLGRSAIDIKAFYMGLTGCPWEETSMLYLSPRFLKGQQLPHDALADARLQANLFRKLLAQARGEKMKISE